MYQLIISVMLAGTLTDYEMKIYDRFEECWEAATILVHNRSDMTATCMLIENK